MRLRSIITELLLDTALSMGGNGKMKIANKYVAGIIMYSAVNSLYQDVIGKEGYIERISNGWISSWITVPLAILFLVVSVWLYKQKDEASDD